MGAIVTLVIIVFVPVCVVLTLIILLQDSKGEGLSSSAFGGSGMESVLGGHGAASFLSKLTTWVAIGFMVISLFLMRFYGESVDGTLTPYEEENTEQTQQATVEDQENAEDSKGAITDISEESTDDGTTTEETTDTTDEDTKGTISP
ncbi:preprotein translocase subunit SecG [Candidatus Poribacteria bacterium]|nr:MAG: preprotein translocase subunit SecG [Candidatus Poribacteria bacterium]